MQFDNLRPQILLALVFAGTLGIILMALGFEHIGGLKPCPLCLTQRYAYYAAMIALPIALLLEAQKSMKLAAFLTLLVGLGFLANSVLAGYHTGVEWKFWPGPASCAGGNLIGPLSGNLIDEIQKNRIVACDEVQWRFLGLSFAGYNVFISLLFGIVSLLAAKKLWHFTNTQEN